MMPVLFSCKTRTSFWNSGQTAGHEKQAGPAKKMKISLLGSPSIKALKESVLKAVIGSYIVAGV